MDFYTRLQNETAAERAALLDAPIIHKALAGTLTLEAYRAFLGQAYHHVKHTTPLLMAVGSRIPEDKEWLRDAVAEYIEEEVGHQEWILNDIRACGGDAEEVRHSQPLMPTELMVAYAYDTVMRKNPIGFFGMVQVLEGTSVSIATQAARTIQSSLGLPNNAFSYLLSHGDLDQDHIQFFAGLMNKLDNAEDQNAVIHTAKVMYKLYGDIFRALPLD